MILLKIASAVFQIVLGFAFGLAAGVLLILAIGFLLVIIPSWLMVGRRNGVGFIEHALNELLGIVHHFRG
jgi:uncharacterized membrane protein YGL010W